MPTLASKPATEYPPETVGSIMATTIPTCHEHDTVRDMLRTLAQGKWDSIRNVYVVKNQKLRGVIEVGQLVQATPNTRAAELMRAPRNLLHPDVDQEEAVFVAVKDDTVAIPVVDNEQQLVGAITAHMIIDIMHQEHIEDALLSSGIRHGKSGVGIAKLATERTSLIVRSRAPWLIGGLAVGLGLGLISSFFEHALERSIALAYFIPVVAYIADSVGTQSEAITVRALATLKLNYATYLFKEFLVGVVLGALLGTLGAIGAFFISHSMEIAVVVGISLFAASAVAAVLAALIPMFFKARGKDPALGSGPLATALQDVISVVIYFVVAILLIR